MSLDRLGYGPITPDEMPERVRAIRHQVVNDHLALTDAADVAARADRLAQKALDRLDDVIGIPGSSIDGGGALGRLTTGVDRLNRLVIYCLRGIVAGVFSFACLVIAAILAHWFPSPPH